MRRLLSSIFLTLLIPVSAAFGASPSPHPAVIKAVQSLALDSAPSYSFRGIPNAIFGTLAPRKAADPEQAARAALADLSQLFELTADDSFALIRVMGAQSENTHVRLSHLYKGVPVVGSEVIVHMNRKTITGINGELAAGLSLSVDPKREAKDLVASTLKAMGARGAIDPRLQRIGQLTIWSDASGSQVVYPLTIGYVASDFPALDDVYVDADSGAIVAALPLIQTQFPTYDQEVRGADRSVPCLLGTNASEMWDASRVLFDFSDPMPDWAGLSGDDSPSFSSWAGYWNLYKSAYFYEDVMNWRSWDGGGAPIRSINHARFATSSGGCTGLNAAWVRGDNIMVFGDGNGSLLDRTALALDVIAHEFTHGVTGQTARLEYVGESGALNEGTSDILGEAAEAHDRGRNDWKLGTAIFTPGAQRNPLVRGDDALRYMSNPTLDHFNEVLTGRSPNQYADRVEPACTARTANSGNDNCGVHANSGIANQFFYLLSEGGTLPPVAARPTPCELDGTCPRIDICLWGGCPTATPLTIEKARYIWFDALVNYLGPTSNYAAARRATVRAAQDRYGECSKEWISVHDAWDAVGVAGTRSRPCRQLLLMNPGFERDLAGWNHDRIADPDRAVTGIGPLVESHDGRRAVLLRNGESLSRRLTLPAISTGELSLWVSARPSGAGPHDAGARIVVTVSPTGSDPATSLIHSVSTTAMADGPYHRVTLPLIVPSTGPFSIATLSGADVTITITARYDSTMPTDVLIDDTSLVVEP